MNYVIGDIHGEYTKLLKLTEQIIHSDSEPVFIFIGDYTNKGEDPYRTLKLMYEIRSRYQCIFLRGNHEFFWENMEKDELALQNLIRYGARNTSESIEKGSSLE